METRTGNVSINSENMLPIIKKWLYSDKDIFVREVISNGCDAISKLHKLEMMGEYQYPDKFKDSIRILVNPDKKTVKFIDTGLGMTAEEVEKYITQIAFSGATAFFEKYKDKANKDDIIGHFGLGFYSVFMVSDMVTIDTLSYQKDAKPVHWECDGGDTYTIGDGDYSQVGTCVTLHLNEDNLEFANEYRMREVLERYCRKVFLGFKEASAYFKEPEKHVVVGNPVRSAFFGAERRQARENLGIGQDDFVIFSFGGSQGAGRINEVVCELMKEMNGRAGETLIFGTGSRFYDDIVTKARSAGITEDSNIRIRSYIDDMPDCLAAADLVISRSGALSVAETCVVGRASILIPSPNVTGNHQYFNAKSVADQGGAVLMEEKELTAERLIQTVRELRADPKRLEAMGRAAFGAVPHDAAERVYSEIQE